MHRHITHLLIGCLSSLKLGDAAVYFGRVDQISFIGGCEPLLSFLKGHGEAIGAMKARIVAEISCDVRRLPPRIRSVRFLATHLRLRQACLVILDSSALHFFGRGLVLGDEELARGVEVVRVSRDSRRAVRCLARARDP